MRTFGMRPFQVLGRSSTPWPPTAYREVSYYAENDLWFKCISFHLPRDPTTVFLRLRYMGSRKFPD